MERRKFLGLAASAGAVGGGGFAAAGCGVSTSTESVTLRVVAADYGSPEEGNSSQGYWDALVRAFHYKHPGINVDVTVHSWKDVDKKVAQMVKAGRAPDIAQMGSYAEFAAQGRLYTADELLSIPVQADFMTGLVQAGKVRRVQYGMPFAASTRVLFYNKSLFVKARLDPDEPPASWKQLARAAARLKAAGVKIPYGLPLGPEEAPAEALMWMLGGGGAYTDRAGAYTIDAAANVRTFNWLRDHLVARKLTNHAPRSTDRQELFDAFGRGEVGMLNGHPTLMKQAARRGVKYGTAALPGVRGPSGGTLGVADWVMAFKEGGRRQQAGAFLDFVFSEKNHYAFVDRYDLLPVTISANERMRNQPGHEELRRFQDQLGSAEFYPVGNVSWSGVSADIKKSIGRAVSADSSPAEVLAGLQRRAQEAESAAKAS